MNQDLLLVKCITLLYLEGNIEGIESSADVVRTVLEDLQLPELVVGVDTEKEKILSLKATAIALMGQDKDNPIGTTELLQRLRVDCKYDDRLYDSLAQSISKVMEPEQTKRVILSMRRTINEFLKEKEIGKLIKDASMEFGFRREKIKDMRSFVSDLCSRLEKYHVLEENQRDPALIADCSTDDADSMDRAYAEVCKSDAARMRTGWQGVNEMLQGGFGRSEQWVLGALQHSYKTGFTLTLTKQLAIYNTPIMRNPAKKPLIMRISFEDTLPANMRFLYKNIVLNETGQLPPDEFINSKDNIRVMRDHVIEKTSINGYAIKMYQVNPSDWGYRDLQNLVMQEEAAGYEVHVCIVDYLSVMSLKGCDVEAAGHALRDLYKRTRNFFVERNILFMTPHQLSTDAKMLIREGRNDFVKQLEGRGYYAGSKQIDQVVDGELFMHIEKLNGRAYLTLFRGKQRNVEAIDDAKKYVVLPFPVVGPIPDDIGKARIDLKKVGGGAVGSGDDLVPFHEFDN